LSNKVRNKDPIIDNNIIKADIFAAKFFPKTKMVDFSNIKIEIIINQKALNISPIILVEKINKLIKSLLNKKALGLNGIPNKILKVVVLIIAKDLAKTASNYFTNKIIPESLKKSIIIILRKKRKKNSFLGSYRLITLKNTLAKVLKKYVANIMLKAVEEYRLFF